jgi:hypothetical protein
MSVSGRLADSNQTSRQVRKVPKGDIQPYNRASADRFWISSPVKPLASVLTRPSTPAAARCRIAAQRTAPWPLRGRAESNADLLPSWPPGWGGGSSWRLLAAQLLRARLRRAQQPAMPVIGFLSSRSAIDSAAQVAAFRAAFGEAGYVERQNVAGALY